MGNPVKTLYVKDGKRINIGRYPSFSKTGSVTGMKKLFYGEDCFLLLCGSFIYNVPEEIYYKGH